MLKFLKKLLVILLLLAVGFIVVSIESGGERFRRIGDFFKKGTYEAGETADLIKESSENIKKTTIEAVDSVKRTGEKIADTSDKLKSKVTKTREAADGVSEDMKDETVKAAAEVEESTEVLKETAGVDDTDK